MSPHTITLFRALADGTRIRLLALLHERPQCVEDLAFALGIRQPKASRHLAYLRRVGLVKRTRSGRRIFYGFRAPTDPFERRLLGELLAQPEASAAGPGGRPRPHSP